MMLARGLFFLQVIDRTGWLPTGAEKLYAWDSSGKPWYLARKDFRPANRSAPSICNRRIQASGCRLSVTLLKLGDYLH
jgi:hypothetical protein